MTTADPTPVPDAAPLPAWVLAARSELDAKLGVELVEVSAQRAVGRAPVQGNTQPMGLWHGGASGVLAESLASMAAHAHALTLDRVAVGVDLNATHHRAVRTGWVHGTATALRLGRSLASYEVVLTDDEGERVCTARLTCALVRPPGAARTQSKEGAARTGSDPGAARD